MVNTMAKAISEKTVKVPEEQYRAFLKWAGGKGQLVSEIYSLMPRSHSGRLIEPFVGSGIVSLNAFYRGFKEIVIADTNDALIAVWSQLKWNGDFIDEVRSYFAGDLNHEDTYYNLRTKFNFALKHWNEKDVAKLFIYLNRHGFNGLCRFNSSGGFNVPFGRYDKPYFPQAELEHAVKVMRHTRIFHKDFQRTFEDEVLPGDVVYCDPPYIPLSSTSNFTAYSKEPFGPDLQRALAHFAMTARDKGATVIISNNDVPFARELYKKADEIRYPQVSKKISCKADGRKKSQEILAVFRP